MSNFLNFIEDDIEAKKTLITSLPVNTKTDIKKYNKNIDNIIDKYNEYKTSVKKYLETKSKSFDIKKHENVNLKNINKYINNLEHVRFLLNPTNTYFEKHSFDNLIYQISNYQDTDFDSLNNLISQFLDKFDLVGISLTSDEFDYTCYVNDYMNSVLEERRNKNNNKILEKFEKIYWLNPEIMEHIELNFRKLIRKYQKKFINYIQKLQEEVKTQNKINSYEDCVDKLKVAYEELSTIDEEDIPEIIKISKSGEIDINNYFEDSKVRTTAYSSLMMDLSNLEDKNYMKKFYNNLHKLKNNIEELYNYIKFKPIIKSFKLEYEKQISDDSKNKNQENKNLKNIEFEIIKKESQLDKFNKKIFSGKIGFFKSRNENAIKKLKINSVKKAKELSELYKEYDKEYFKDKVLSILNSSLTVPELFHLYYSFDFFKKILIKKVFNIIDNEEIKKISDSFDIFAMNPTNVIVNGLQVFEESNLEKVIVNKYRLENINLSEENLVFDELNPLLEKIKLILRINTIEKSDITIEKIWFIVQIEKYQNAENKKE